MSFIAIGVLGAATDQTGRTTSSKAEAAERINNVNDVVELTTHKATQEVTETFVANSGNITNTAVSGQVSSTEVIISHEKVEKVDGYPEVTTVKRVIVAAATTTTTTTTGA
jgi:hypothetical protein